jgi:hypothetical protein
MLEAAAAAAADHLFDTRMFPYNFCLTASCISRRYVTDSSSIIALMMRF